MTEHAENQIKQSFREYYCVHTRLGKKKPKISDGSLPNNTIQGM